MPIDFYAKVGLSRFIESKGYDDKYEGTFYLKAYWNFDFCGNRVRFGLGEGVSYTTAIIRAEQLEADDYDGKTSKFLNYIDISLDFDVGRLVGYKPFYGTSLGWALKHRSGIYGLINGVRHAGSNYNTAYIEKKF